jgi:hypothetical protein
VFPGAAYKEAFGKLLNLQYPYAIGCCDGVGVCVGVAVNVVVVLGVGV